LPFPEPYHLPASTVQAIARARDEGGRVLAIGTTVTRALEHAAALGGGAPHAGPGVADQRIGASTRLQVVDALLSGAHEAGSSHHELLRAFVSAAVLARVDAALAAYGFLTHEFGDSVLVREMRTPVRTTSVASRRHEATIDDADCLESLH
jgi:S-adenosylmethionine:tRNA ribosyltransferase-isomerase